MWRHLIAAVPAVVLLIIMFKAVTRPAPSYSQPLTEAERRGLTAPKATDKAADKSTEELVWKTVFGLCVASAAFFFVDSMLRQYRTGKTTAIALAVMGLITFGLFSLVYYAIWGRHPLKPAVELYGDGRFCPRCLALTTDRQAPGTLVANGFFGTQPMGAADPCVACKSVVRTIWLWFVVPVVPLGSYRMIAIEREEYVGRRTSLYWPQVLPVYGIVLAVAGVIAFLVLR
jgi:hypothetical protein